MNLRTTFVKLCCIASSILLLIFSLWPAASTASFDGLNEDFGGGIVTLDDGAAGLPGNSPTPADVIVDSDGRVLVVSYTGGGSQPYPASLFRLNDDGTLDTEFGTVGSVQFDLNALARPRAIVIDNGGNILVGGYYGNDSNSRGSFLARFDSSGALDESFGNHFEENSTTHDGYALITTEGYDIFDIEIDPEGTIFVVGEFMGDSFIAKYDGDGLLDESFADDGFSWTSGRDFKALERLSDGTFIVGGNDSDPFFMHFLEDGSLDTEWGDSGEVRFNIPDVDFDYAEAIAMAIGSDGRVSVVGYYYNSDEDQKAFVTMGTIDGVREEAFGTDGAIIIDEGNVGIASDVIFDGDGSVVVTGLLDDTYAALKAYLADGSQDLDYDSAEVISAEADAMSENTYMWSANDILTLVTASYGPDLVYVAQYHATSDEAAEDTDGDGVPDETDNCPEDFNASQTDIDNDMIGDACDVTDDSEQQEASHASGTSVRARVPGRAVSPVPAEIAPDVPFTRNLFKGLSGSDVKSLQEKLIALDSGPAAKALAQVGATGYFGQLTHAAVIEYQKLHNISPAVGFFGPKTRASMEKI